MNVSLGCRPFLDGPCNPRCLLAQNRVLIEIHVLHPFNCNAESSRTRRFTLGRPHHRRHTKRCILFNKFYIGAVSNASYHGRETMF